MKFKSWNELVVWSSHPDRVKADCPHGKGCVRICIGPKLCGMCEDGIREDRVWEGLLQFGAGPNKVKSRRSVQGRAPVSAEARKKVMEKALARLVE